MDEYSESKIFESYPINKAVNTYRILENLDVPYGQQYVVYSYFAYKEPRNDGSIGKQVFLGAYPTPEKAMMRVDEIMKKTGHPLLYATEACMWEDIDTDPRKVENRDKTRHLRLEKKSKKDLELQYEKDVKEWKIKKEKRENLTKELEEDDILEKDPTTVEHYAKNWYTCILNKSQYEYHKGQAEQFLNVFNKRKEKIQDQYRKDPSVDDKWLPLYKTKLENRGETHVFEAMEKGYQLLKDEILKL